MTHPETTAPHITLTGFGEVGQAYALALRAQGADVLLFHPAPGANTRAAAARLGVEIVADAARAYRDCELVLSVVPGMQSLAAAQLAAPLLKPGALFVDLSSAAPQTLREAAGLFAAEAYVDVAIMGAVSIHGHRTPLLASGPGAVRFRQMTQPFGFSVDVLTDSRPGDATALKLVRSVLTKGFDAVVIECLLVAESLGLRQQLLAQIGDLDASPMSELIAMFLRTHAPAATRRLHEIEAIEETLRGLDVPLIVTPAARRRYARSIATLGTAAQLPQQPEGASLYDRVLPWMLEAERRTPFEPGDD